MAFGIADAGLHPEPSGLRLEPSTAGSLAEHHFSLFQKMDNLLRSLSLSGQGLPPSWLSNPKLKSGAAVGVAGQQLGIFFTFITLL